MDTAWNFLAGGAVLGVIASLWTYLKGFAWRAVGLLVRRVEVPTDAAHEALTAHLIARYRRSGNYDRVLGASWDYQRDGRYGLIPYEMFGNRTLIFWNGWIPFFFSNQLEHKASASKNGNANDMPGVAKIHSSLTFLRGTLDVEKLLRDACTARNHISWTVEDEQEAKKNRFVIHYIPKRTDGDDDFGGGSDGLAWYQQGHYRLLAHTPDQLGKARTANGPALENLIFPPRIKDLIREIELWRKSRDWYLQKGIPWKRGWLLYGPPGTGKTALARAFAEDLNMPIYVYNLAEMSNHDLMKAWAEMQVNVPCIALIEDIDNVFHGRENISRKNAGMLPMMMPPRSENDSNVHSQPRGLFGAPLTFDCLLNCLDGVERADGIFTIVTTNDIAKIDPALGQPRKLPDGTVEFISTRPGRVDKAVELGPMEPADKKRMASRILGAFEREHLEMIAFIDRYPDLQETPAQFQERCAQVALRCFWKEQAAEKLECREPSRNGAH